MMTPILITNEKEVIIHANDNHAEISEKLLMQLENFRK